MAKTKLSNLPKYVLLVLVLAVGTWLGVLISAFSRTPAMAIQAYASSDSASVPAALGGAFLRWFDYDPNSNVLSEQPLLHFACAKFGEAGSDREKALHVVRLLVANGAYLDSRYNGLTPLHESVLYSADDKSVELVRTLLAVGADPALRISRPGKQIDGLTVPEFAEFLADKRPAAMRETVQLLRQAASNNSFKVTPEGAPQFNR
jgi:hypothetical protein